MQANKPVLHTCILKFTYCRYSKLIIKGLRLFGANARNPYNLQKPGRYLLFKVFVVLKPSRIIKLNYLFIQALSDALLLSKCPILDGLVQILFQRLNSYGRIMICPELKRILTFQLKE